MTVLNNPSARKLVTLLRGEGAMHRLQVAKTLDVQPSTVTRMVNPMIEQGLIEEVDDADRKGGRGFPSKLIRLNPTGLLSAGVFIDPEQCHTCIVDSFGKLLAEKTVALTDRHFDTVISIASTLIAEQISELGLQASSFLGCGISYPGQHTEQVGVVRPTRYLPDWPSFNVTTELVPYFGMPVHHLNDIKSACLAEMLFGACTGISNFCYVGLGHGIGGAAVVNNSLYLGNGGIAAEFGGLFPKSKPRPSGADLLSTLGEAGFDYRRLDQISEEVLKNDTVLKWLERSETQLRELCLIIARTFAPEVIVFGGALPDFIFDNLIARLSRATSLGEDFEADPPRIQRATADKKPQLGAAAVPVYFNTSLNAISIT